MQRGRDYDGTGPDGSAIPARCGRNTNSLRATSCCCARKALPCNSAAAVIGAKRMRRLIVKASDGLLQVSGNKD